MKYPVANNAAYAWVSADSRECGPDTAFVADALSARYTDAAKAAGCAAVLDAQALKSHFDLNLKIVGITGTNGKTTTAALIYSLLLDLGFKAALQGTRGFFINGEKIEGKGFTTPMLLDNYARIDRAKKAGCDFFITEVSSHAIAQKRMEGIECALKIHTNITGDHLDFHGTFENYRAVKNSFFEDETLKLINKDDPQIAFNPKNARTYGIENPATFKLEAYSPNEGLSGVISYGEEKAMFHSALMGHFNLYNILAALGAVKLLTDKPLQSVCDQLENFGGVSGRMEVVSLKPTVIVDFAHTHDGIEKALTALFPQKCVAVFGAGGDRDATKRPLMGQAAARHAVRLFITSDNPRHEEPMAIIEAIKAGCGNHPDVRIEPDRRAAIAGALASLAPDEILVILGKGDEETQQIGDRLLPFNDKNVVLELLKEQEA
ncbi:MAG: UDP-N-acetylmuramoyl-L-alanyl-D-glutamate--2,6-diaminopimelate ligase [Campylobacterales bacterium]